MPRVLGKEKEVLSSVTFSLLGLSEKQNSCASGEPGLLWFPSQFYNPSCYGASTPKNKMCQLLFVECPWSHRLSRSCHRSQGKASVRETWHHDALPQAGPAGLRPAACGHTGTLGQGTDSQQVSFKLTLESRTSLTFRHLKFSLCKSTDFENSCSLFRVKKI